MILHVRHLVDDPELDGLVESRLATARRDQRLLTEKRPSMSVTSKSSQHFIGPYIDSAVLLSSQKRATASRSVAFVKTGDVISRRHSSSMALWPFTTASAATLTSSRRCSTALRAPIISTTWGSHGRRLAGSPDAIELGCEQA